MGESAKLDQWECQTTAPRSRQIHGKMHRRCTLVLWAAGPPRITGRSALLLQLATYIDEVCHHLHEHSNKPASFTEAERVGAPDSSPDPPDYILEGLVHDVVGMRPSSAAFKYTQGLLNLKKTIPRARSHDFGRCEAESWSCTSSAWKTHSGSRATTSSVRRFSSTTFAAPPATTSSRPTRRIV